MAEPQVEADFARGVTRRRLIDALLPLRAEGKSFEECAAVLGSSGATLWRLEKKWKQSGEAGLATNHGNAGRPRLANFDVFTEEARAFVRRLTIQTESLPLALERLSDAGPCSPEARDLIDRYRESGNYPPSFYRFFRVTAEEWEKAKGKKHFDGITSTARRGMWYIDEAGQRVEILAGDLVEADDVSTDVPYALQLPDGRWCVGRQILVFRDRRSRKWLGAYAVARERDSYRGEDIVRACRELVDAWGLVGRFRFERGSWESNVVEGIKLKHRREDGDRVGGITGIIPIDHVFTSRAKGTIEGGFRMMHKVMGMYGVRIGKSRGEYEQPTKDMLAVNNGHKTPAECGFIEWSDLQNRMEQAFTLMNGRPVRYQELNAKFAPDDVWAQEMQARPEGRLPACPVSHLWRFLPVKSEVGVGVARAGHVKVSVPGHPLPFFFRLGGPGICLVGNGVPPEGIERTLPMIEAKHRVLVCFDPQRAAEGAVIVNADRGPRNIENWALGQRICVAPLAVDAPQYDLSGGSRDSDDLVAKRSRDDQVRASFTSIGLYGQGARRTRQDHDGQGNVARVETGAAARQATTTARPVQARRKAAAPAVPVPVEDLTATPAPRWECDHGDDNDFTPMPGETAYLRPQLPTGRAPDGDHEVAGLEFEDLDLR